MDSSVWCSFLERAIIIIIIKASITEQKRNAYK